MNKLFGKQIMTESKKSDSLNPFTKVFDPAVELYSRGFITGFASFWFGRIDIKLFTKNFTTEMEKYRLTFYLFSLIFSLFNIIFSTETN